MNVMSALRKLALIPAAFLVLSSAGTPAAWGATTTQSINETISVPGGADGAFMCVDSECVDVEGVRDVSINVKATGVVAENTTLGTTGANCARVDRTIQLTLSSGGSGSVTLKYSTVDPENGVSTSQSNSMSFGSPPGTGGSTPQIKLCVR